MKRYSKLFWNDWNIEHIAGNNVIVDEVEEVIFSRSSRIRRGRDKGIYYIFGQTFAGRYLFIVVRDLGRGVAKPITARDMESRERHLYRSMI